MNVDSYLERLRYKGSTEPGLATLRELHLAHLLSVPFENLDIHTHRPIVLELEHLFEKIVTQKRGGFCYELNGMFAWLLRALGFEVTLLSARVSAGSGAFGPEYDHLTLCVDLKELWLADVGFGDSFREPLCLCDPIEQKQMLGTYRLRTEGQDWFYDAKNELGEWHTEYRFTLQPRVLADFVDMCNYQQSSPKSSFTQRIVCTLATPDGRVTLRNDRLITTRNGVREETPLAGDREFSNQLRRIFEIDLSLEDSEVR